MGIINRSLNNNIKVAEKSKQYKKNMSLPTLDFKSENVSLRQGTHENLDFSQDFINKKYLYKITELNKDALSIEDFCENIEQDARRYSRCLNGDSKVVMI